MAATLQTEPSALELSKDPIWVELETDLITQNFAQVEIAISAANNNQNETFLIAWGSNSLTFTLKNSPDNSGLQLPVYSGGDLNTYAASVAEALRENEILHTDFRIIQTASLTALKYIYIRARTSGLLDITASDTVSNFATTVTDGTADTSAENLRAVVEVWQETADIENDVLLLKSHAPYDLATSLALFDIAPAFIHLAPYLPPENTIPGIDNLGSYARNTATGTVEKYYLRYADKYGAPPVAEALQKSSTYRAIYGSQSPAALNDYKTQQIRHAYNREDGTTFRKPVSMYQPDWLYWWSNAESGANYRYQLDLYWSDGNTTSAVVGNSFFITPNTLYCHTVGPPHLQLDQASPPSAGAQLLRYDFSIVDLNQNPVQTVLISRYEIKNDCHEWGLILLYDNGLGGLETIWLDGKKAEIYEPAGQDIARKLRTKLFDLKTGEFESFGAVGQTVWTANTGWYDDPFYLLHLRQIPLSNRAWIVDKVNQRFIRVIVEAKTLEVRQDDADLYSLTFTLRAAWQDMAANI